MAPGHSKATPTLPKLEPTRANVYPTRAERGLALDWDKSAKSGVRSHEVPCVVGEQPLNYMR